jgi:hypothetical protein
VTEAQRKQLAELWRRCLTMLIDTSDIPELPDEVWSAGVLGRF